MHCALVVPEARRTARPSNRPGIVRFPDECGILFYGGDPAVRTVILSTQGTFRSGLVSHWETIQRRVGESPPGNASVRLDGTIAAVG
jgi:hypothetical protein